MSLRSKLMNEIKNDKIRMKSRWVFIAQKIGLQSGLALTVVLLVFLINAFFFYIKSNHLLLPLHYGTAWWQELLHSLPYDLILIIIVLLVLLNFIIKKFEFSYKKPFVVIFSAFIIFIIFWATALFIGNFNEMLRSNIETYNLNIPYVNDFYMNRCGGGCHMMDCPFRQK